MAGDAALWRYRDLSTGTGKSAAPDHEAKKSPACRRQAGPGDSQSARSQLADARLGHAEMTLARRSAQSRLKSTLREPNGRWLKGQSGNSAGRKLAKDDPKALAQIADGLLPRDVFVRVEDQ